MPNQGHKLRNFRLSDTDFEKLQNIVKANDCRYLGEFLKKIIAQELIVVKNFSKTP